eukprot:COSAG01_NODE_35272_length_534_cov_1.618391_1_plen_120_part_00
MRRTQHDTWLPAGSARARLAAPLAMSTSAPDGAGWVSDGKGGGQYLPTYGRSDANGFAALGPTPTLPTYLPPSVVAHRATTLTTFVAVSVRKNTYTPLHVRNGRAATHLTMRTCASHFV